MTDKKQRLPKNAAKVEFIIHSETIKALLSEGFNLRNVYNKLHKLDNFTMSYFTLCALYRKTVKKENNKEQIKPTAAPKIASAPAASKKFTRPEDVDRGSLF